tara:strand:- start:677 stop:1063 length:387 start_codon:yes stop_codon:yes gene_type:complete
MSDAGAGQLQNYSVDQAAGAVVLVLGAVASLLLVIWQSKCHCKMNLCYIFQCERRPPSEEEMKTLQDQIKDRKDEKDKKEILDKEKEILVKEDEILEEVKIDAKKPVDRTSKEKEPEPQPEMLIPELS